MDGRSSDAIAVYTPSSLIIRGTGRRSIITALVQVDLEILPRVGIAVILRDAAAAVLRRRISRRVVDETPLSEKQASPWEKDGMTLSCGPQSTRPSRTPTPPSPLTNLADLRRTGLVASISRTAAQRRFVTSA